MNCATVFWLPLRTGSRAHSLAVDLSDPSAPSAVLGEARRLWPRLDILVNNAGIQGPDRHGRR